MKCKIASVVVFLGFLLISCTKERELDNVNSLTKQLYKVVTLYNEGDEKIETVELNATKKEIYSGLKDSVLVKVKQSYLKAFVLPDDFEGEGLFAPKSGCGNLLTLHVFMDNEDSRSRSYALGDVGMSNIDRNGNANLYFCIVPKGSAGSGVLRLYNIPMPGIELKRYFDNEDRGNVSFANIVKPTGESTRIRGAFKGNTFTENTELTFRITSYGISSGFDLRLGGVEGGIIYTDDADDNSNFLEKITIAQKAFIELGPELKIVNERIESYPGFIEGGKNTKLILGYIR